MTCTSASLYKPWFPLVGAVGSPATTGRREPIEKEDTLACLSRRTLRTDRSPQPRYPMSTPVATLYWTGATVTTDSLHSRACRNHRVDTVVGNIPPRGFSSILVLVGYVSIIAVWSVLAPIYIRPTAIHIAADFVSKIWLPALPLSLSLSLSVDC